MKYSIKDFNDILFNGFNFTLDENTINIINKLSSEVGSPSYIKTPEFFKKPPHPVETMSANSFEGLNNYGGMKGSHFKKRKANKNMEVINDDDWESLRTFHATKMEQKVGISVQIDLIRSYLNKMSDKNYDDLIIKIIEVIDTLVESNTSDEEMLMIGRSIFDIASNNRFYSKLYADLYSELVDKFDIIKNIFEASFQSFVDIFENIEYVDADKDYELFCKINKQNEKRKALSAFFVNLTSNGLISQEKMLDVVINLLNQVIRLISLSDKKNEVDELTENISILCGQSFVLHSTVSLDNGFTIMETVEKFAHSKTKLYPSLSNKSIFKYMDMIDM